MFLFKNRGEHAVTVDDIMAELSQLLEQFLYRRVKVQLVFIILSKRIGKALESYTPKFCLLWMRSQALAFIPLSQRSHRIDVHHRSFSKSIDVSTWIIDWCV
jgi:hypothetical protein